MNDENSSKIFLDCVIGGLKKWKEKDINILPILKIILNLNKLYLWVCCNGKKINKNKYVHISKTINIVFILFKNRKQTKYRQLIASYTYIPFKTSN